MVVTRNSLKVASVVAIVAIVATATIFGAVVFEVSLPLLLRPLFPFDRYLGAAVLFETRVADFATVLLRVLVRRLPQGCFAPEGCFAGRGAASPAGRLPVVWIFNLIF